MIIEAGILTGMVYNLYKYNNADKIEKKEKEKEFKNKWNLIMKYTGVKNKNEQTFTVLKYIPREKYGCDCIVSIPWGLDYNDFRKITSIIENNYGATVISNISPEGNSIYIRIAYNLNNADKSTVIKFKWYKLMQNNNDLINKDFKTFEIVKINKKEYGFDLIIEISEGLSYETILKSKIIIENIFKSNILIKYIKATHRINIQVFEINLNKLSFQYQMQLKWYNMLSSLNNPKNYINDSYETFEIFNIQKDKLFGFNCEISIPNGLSFEILKSIEKTICSSFGAYIYIENFPFEYKAKIKVITNPIDDKKPFEIVPTEPYELYFGITHYYEKMIADLTKYPHVLVSGSTGTGKSICIQIAITNNMYNHPTNDFYFAQLTDKQDFEVFRNCKKTKCIATTLAETYKMLTILKNIQKQRNKLFAESLVKNIRAYNKISQKNINYIYVAIDEMATFMPHSKKVDGCDYDIKLKIQDMMNKLVKESRNVGIFWIIGIQRPDMNDLLPNSKSNFRVKLAFSQESSASSKVVCDNDDAVGLPFREGIFMMGDKRVRFKTLFFDENNTVNNLLKDKIDTNHKLIDLNNSSTQDDSNNDKNNKKPATYMGNLIGSYEFFQKNNTNKVKIR